MSNLATLKSALKVDTDYQKFLSVFESLKATLTLDRFLKEAEMQHKSRRILVINARKLSPIDLQETILKDSANRARLTEFRTLLARQLSLLTSATEVTRRKLRVVYSSEISKLGTTSADRTAVLDLVFAKSKEVCREIEAAADTIDLYIKDIDQAGYAYRNCVDLLKMILDRRGVEGSI